MCEIPKVIVNDSFPPVIERKIKDVLENKIAVVDWESLKEVPIMIWNPPVDLPPFYDEETPLPSHRSGGESSRSKPPKK